MSFDAYFYHQPTFIVHASLHDIKRPIGLGEGEAVGDHLLYAFQGARGEEGQCGGIRVGVSEGGGKGTVSNVASDSVTWDRKRRKARRMIPGEQEREGGLERGENPRTGIRR